MNPETQTLKITKGKNIKESKDLKSKNYRKKKKVIQHRNIRKRCVTHKRIIHCIVIEIYQTGLDIAKTKAKIQMLKLSKCPKKKKKKKEPLDSEPISY